MEKLSNIEAELKKKALLKKKSVQFLLQSDTQLLLKF